MNKKDFWSGLFSGLLIATFLVCCVLCGRIIYNQSHGTNISQNNSTGNSFIDGLAGNNTSSPITNSVISNPSVAAKVQVLESTIDQYFIEDVSKEDIENGIYDGIMSSLNDPYAAYYTPEEWIEMLNSTEGIYFGIGAYLMTNQATQYPQITGFIDNSPASESELRIDDYIYKVNGEDVYGMELSDVVSMIKGDEGTTVTLTIVRPSTGEEFDVTLERRRVESPTVSYEIKEVNSEDNPEAKIGYIKISEFDDVTVDQFAEALAVVKGNHVDGIMLDLRGNPGGSLSAVVQIAQMMLPKGLVVYTEDKNGQRQEYTCDGAHELDIPMVVLVNGGSASASEILSGAIKDYGIGTLVGTTTYGKGIVQRLISLNDGSAVKLTVSHYYTPLGNDIHKVGIVPDVEVELDIDAYLEDGSDNQMDKATEVLINLISN